MRIIKFKGFENWTSNIEKKTQMPEQLPDGRTVYREVSTGVIDKTITHWRMWWVPVDKINSLNVWKGKYYVNDIQVKDEQEFNDVLSELFDIMNKEGDIYE